MFFFLLLCCNVPIEEEPIPDATLLLAEDRAKIRAFILKNESLSPQVFAEDILYFVSKEGEGEGVEYGDIIEIDYVASWMEQRAVISTSIQEVADGIFGPNKTTVSSKKLTLTRGLWTLSQWDFPAGLNTTTFLRAMVPTLHGLRVGSEISYFIPSYHAFWNRGFQTHSAYTHLPPFSIIRMDITLLAIER